MDRENTVRASTYPVDLMLSLRIYSLRAQQILYFHSSIFIVQELCESRGGRPGLSVLTSLLVSVDVKNY